MEARQPRRRVTQRRPLCCTECVKKKLRCSKVIPCSACVERGKGHLCKRETVQVRSRTTADTSTSTSTAANLDEGGPLPSPNSYEPPLARPESRSPSNLFTQTTASLGLPIPGQHPTEFDTEGTTQRRTSPPRQSSHFDGVSQDAATALEFLAQSRQRVMRLGQNVETVASITTTNYGPPPDVFTPISKDQARSLITYHQEHLAWIHNVVHFPTFQAECELFFETGCAVNQFWLPLYYSILAMTLYLVPPDTLQEDGILEPHKVGEVLYKRTIKTLYALDFMSNHSVTSIQSICVSIFVGHNLAESDFTSTLMGSAIRIAHSLNLHRLGPDVQGNGTVEDQIGHLIDREVRKRIWWFLVRQDWLQIPFTNTYTIHPSQFNTPMPKLCHEEMGKMVQGGKVIEQDIDTYTQGSHNNIVNHISVLIRQTQDRMLNLGHPDKSSDGLRKLYEQVLLADSELRAIIRKLPVFYRQEPDNTRGDLPANIQQQKRATLLSISHKFLTIHRHFQVLSFKDPWFAFTKLSCLSIARRALREIFLLPENQHTWPVRVLWTTNTHLVAAAIFLIFNELFTRDDQIKMLDSDETLSLAHQVSKSLQQVCDRNAIARKGVCIIESLLTLAQENHESDQFDLEKIVAHVREDAPAQTDIQSGVENLDFLNYLGWPSPTEMNLGL